MPPINVDGSTVSAVTVDGTDVSQITVDGSTVFQATQQGSIWYANNYGRNDPGYPNKTIYELNDTGSALQSFNAPAGTDPYEVYGIGVDSNNCIWSTNPNPTPSSIYQITQGGNIIQSFNAPVDQNNAPDANGLDVDSTNCIWITTAGGGTGQSLYKIDQTGSSTPSSFYVGNPGGSGLGVGPDDCIWLGGGTIYKLDQSASNISNFNTPTSAGANGLGVDAFGCIWVDGDSVFPDSIQPSLYKINQSGTLLDSFSLPRTGDLPDTSPKGIGIEYTHG